MINSRLLTPEWTVRINGRELTEMQRLAVSEINFEERLTFTSKVEVVIDDYLGLDLSMNDLSYESDFSLQIGWGEPAEEIFNGELVEITPEFQHERASALRLVAYDRSYHLKRMRWPAEIYPKGTMLGIARSIFDKYRAAPFGLDYVIDDLAQMDKYLLSDTDAGFRPDNISDWEFISETSDNLGLMLFVRGRTIYLVRRDYIQRPHFTAHTMFISPQLNFYHQPLSEQESDSRGVLLYSFLPRNRSLKQRDRVEVVDWYSIDDTGKVRGDAVLHGKRDSKNYTEMRVQTSKVETFMISGKAAQDRSAAMILAQAEIEKRARKFVEGNGSLKGWPYVRLGQEHNFIVNALGDIGRSFSGMYFITGTEHRWTRAEGYRTNIDVERRALTA